MYPPQIQTLMLCALQILLTVSLSDVEQARHVCCLKFAFEDCFRASILMLLTKYGKLVNAKWHTPVYENGKRQL